MTRWIALVALVIVAVLVISLWPDHPELPERSESVAMTAVATNPVSAELLGATPPLRFDGRTSFNLAASAPELAAGQVHARAWNLAFFKVPQGALTRREDTRPETGLLGFAVSGKGGELAYDAAARTLTGELKGYVDSAYLGRLKLRPGLSHAQPEHDLVETAFQSAVLSIHVELEDPLELAGLHARTVTARFRAELDVLPGSYKQIRLRGYHLIILQETLRIKLALLGIGEVLRSLCVQPVRISRPGAPGSEGEPTTEESGEGLEFGKPGVELQWDKADTALEFRDFKTVENEAYWIIEDSITDDTLDTLHETVEVEECVEVFFVHDFDPEDFVGGGWTNGGGKGSAKVVTSDANARRGVDFNHLAHELGHVLGLKHPGAAPTETMQAADSGTLMCSSGFANDNPGVNSAGNESRLQNPLLTFSHRPPTDGLDCASSDECGPCP